MAQHNFVSVSMRGYSGSGWLRSYLGAQKKPRKLSDFGALVADLVGDLEQGIYHAMTKSLVDAEWENENRIEFSVVNGGRFGTVDFDYLTRLVFLAHEYGVKVEIESSPRRADMLKLIFHRMGAPFAPTYHPTLEEAVEMFNKGKG